MRRGPRSARLLTAHRTPAPAYQPSGPVHGPAGAGPLSPAPSLSVPPAPPLPPAQRRALARRAWAWRALLAAWTALTVAAGWAGLRWVGPASLGCLPVMVAVGLTLAWCAAVDGRQREAEMRAEG
ncbi:hypothetical protein [Micromonospora cathayae]|uniref:Uncharacterized protein n=1 Tax=Micromonospora cathayae TaxID=3028804 RepID=A0ABY7ZMQ5_9ACTN|nr:hypothetical protein [Micromonospora sp. HUAS 3]WDZ84046.1 hypothetical protein PVK37_26830 [Micromonospora sp. HUAS 3]